MKSVIDFLAQAGIEQAAARKEAEARAAREALRIRAGLSTERPWGAREAEAVSRAMRRCR